MMSILELKVLQKIHFSSLGLASKLILFLNLNSTLMIQSFLCQQTVWINLTSDMILSRYFDLHVCQISKLFQVAKDLIFPVVTSYKIS